MSDFDLHRDLIGQQGGRLSLNTPALVLDFEALSRNIEAMAAFARAAGIALRPHAKTHKSAAIAKLQIEAGALGVCCAKLGEAEALAAEGVESILITSPVVTPQAIARLAKLHAKIADLRVATDNPANAAALAAALKGAARPLPVIVDIDPGIRRTGVASPEAAVALAEEIKRHRELAYAGVQFYCGAQQHIENFVDRKTSIDDRTTYLQSVIDALVGAGYTPEMISGGGTGTHRIDADLGVLNELQVGSYVFMDKQYRDCDLAGEGADRPPFESALLIDATVISANSPSMATIDSGFKALSTDGGNPQIIAGAPQSAMFVFMGDEHAALIAPDHPFKIGDRVTLTAPHCDPTVNLYDAYHVVRGDTLLDIWPVTARGRSR